MTLTLTPDAETRLQTLASRHGLPPEAMVDALVITALQEDADTSTLTPEEMAEAATALRQSVAEFAAGDWVSLEELETEAAARRARLAQPNRCIAFGTAHKLR